MEIKLEDVTSKKIKENIELVDRNIRKFLYALKVIMDSDELVDMDKLHMAIYAEDTYSYLDDGNTRCAGMHYTVIWSLNLNKTEADILYEKAQFDNDLVTNCLHFTITQDERLTDHTAVHLRFLTLSVNNRKHSNTIDYNNDNYELTSIINSRNLAKTAIELKRIAEENRMYAAAEHIWESLSVLR